MKYQNKNLHRNVVILVIVSLFLSLGFIGGETSAQTKSRSKQTSSKAKPTPSKNAKTAQASNKSKSNDKNSAQKKNSKTQVASKNERNAKSKTASKNDRNAKATKDKKNTSSDRKNTSVSKNSKQTNDKKSAKTNEKKSSNNNRSRVTLAKNTSKTKKETSKTSKDSTKTSKETPVKPTKSNRTNKSSKATNEEKISAEMPQIIVSSLSTPVRSAANQSASELQRAKLGSVYKVVGKSGGWYKVQMSNQPNSIGWIPITQAEDWEKTGNEEIYRQVLTQNYKSDKMSFTEAAEIYEFLSRVAPEVKDETVAADFDFKRLIALRSALNAIPAEKANDKAYQDFLKAQDANIVYSEPSARWHVRSPLFWELHSKNTTKPLGEKIAWEAAKNPLPGECEGYVNCHLFLVRMTDGEYLNFYPNGEHAAESLKNIASALEPIVADLEAKKTYNGPTDSSDRAEFNSLITELRVIISRLGSTEKEKPLQHLKMIAESFR